MSTLCHRRLSDGQTAPPQEAFSPVVAFLFSVIVTQLLELIFFGIFTLILRDIFTVRKVIERFVPLSRV
jgi:hypothetical protein